MQKLMYGFPRNKNCKKCGKEFIAIQPGHVYCGDRKKKTGCSYKAYLESNRKSRQNNIEKRRIHDRKFKRKQRELNTEYIKSQRKLRREYWYKNKEKLKKYNEEYRKNNSERILELNRKRMILKRGVIGSHTKNEWETIKRKNNYCCVDCGISEKELKKIWKGTNFNKLTKDHIVPLSKGGTDYIGNIQPLCISCNSVKKDKDIKIGYMSATFDLFHIGHIKAIKKAKNKCDYLIIGLLSDEAVKYKCDVIIPFNERKEILEEVWMINLVAKQKDLNPYLNLVKFNVNIMFSGDGFEAIEKIAADNAGVVLAKFPYCKKQSTSAIKKRIKKIS